MKVGGGGGEEGNPLPALLLKPFFARSLTLVPRSLLLNRKETLATQANCERHNLSEHMASSKFALFVLFYQNFEEHLTN